jgi:probable F420-dependent oxidoreductase
MDLGVVLPDESPSMPVQTLVDLAGLAEELGYAAAWLPDHILPPGEFGADFGGVHEPIVTMAHLAALTRTITFGTSVMVLPLRNPFLLAKQIATVHELSGGRVVLGVGIGWNEEEYAAVGGEFRSRGAVADDSLAVIRHLLSGGEAPYHGRRFSYESGVFAPVPKTPVPVMVGGNSDAALRRAVRLGDAWHPLRFTMPWLRGAVDRLAKFADDQRRPVPGLVPRIALRLTESPVTTAGRLAGEGTIGQVLDDLAQLQQLGAGTVVLDPFNGDPEETHHPEAAWHALAAVSAKARHLGEKP